MNPFKYSARTLGLLLSVLGVATATSQNTQISGLLFGDAYYVGSNHDEDLDGRNGLWFRRIYLTFDQNLGDGFSSRLRTEMSQPGDFVTKAKMEPFVKDAYVKYKTGKHEIIVGLSGTPTWGLLEKVWGYRSIEKTPLDLYKFGSSRDIGIAAKGSLNGNGTLKYHAMVGNGNSTSSETNEGKKFLLSLAFSPVPSLTLEVYGDLDDREGNTDRKTLQGSVFYTFDAGNVGVMFARQKRDVEDGDTETFDLFSVFGSFRVSEKAKVFVRFDRQFQANPSADKIAYLPFSSLAEETNLFVAGVDIAAGENVHFMPNIELVMYDDIDGDTPEATVLPRITFFYKF